MRIASGSSALFNRKIIYWLSVALVAFIALSFTTPWKALPRLFLLVGVTLALLTLLYNNYRDLFKIDNLVLSACSVVIYVALSNFFHVIELNEIMQSLRWSATTVMFIVAVALSSYYWATRPRIFSRLFILIVLLVSILTMVIHFSQGLYVTRISGVGFMGHPILGPAALMCLWAAGLTLMCRVKPLTKLDYILVSLSFLSLFAITFLSQSRGPLISLTIYIIIMLFVMVLHLDLRKRSFVKVVASIVFFIVVIFGTLSPLVDNMLERGTSYRLDIFEATVEYPPDSILFGTGSAALFEQSPAGKVLKEKADVRIEHPHNLFLSVYYFSGIFSLFAFLLIIMILIARIINSTESNAFISSGLALLFLAIMLNTTDGSRIVAPPSADWMFFWFPFAFLCGVFYSGHDGGAAPSQDQGAST
ncbi:MAG: O-antigen ligase family protein [Marinobacter sp.]|uniref:O-antigen ligase family protein n=1 Tax=Marinobacter sp. TaxID=50741 RepID=UPI0034A0339F